MAALAGGLCRRQRLCPRPEHPRAAVRAGRAAVAPLPRHRAQCPRRDGFARRDSPEKMVLRPAPAARRALSDGRSVG